MPDGVNASLHSYVTMLAKKNYFDYSTMVATAVDFLESDEDDEDARADRGQER